jgi:hypothetical protein
MICLPVNHSPPRFIPFMSSIRFGVGIARNPLLILHHTISNVHLTNFQRYARFHLDSFSLYASIHLPRRREGLGDP